MDLDVIVMGAINMDMYVHVDDFPKYGENIQAKELDQKVGGKGSNQAVTVAKQGVNQALIGTVGNDDFGKQILDSLSQQGVKTDYIVNKDDTQTGIAVAVVDHTGENTFMVILGANMALKAEEVEQAMEPLEGKIFLLNLETSQESVLAALKMAKKKKMYVVLDPAPEGSYFEEALQYADLVTPNQQETERITGMSVNTVDDAKKAAKWIADQGVSDVIVKLGSEGSVLYESQKDHFTIIEATRVKAINTVGAGDIFAGVLASKLAKEPDDLVAAAKLASKASALKVSRPGGQDGIPTKEELDQL
ncbi:ribokinase [Tetragenococcus koreensis]|uniref:Ribokinase n=1 Tax=Tetragenococcus koreensis TaxID=290335 RepID=A0AAN4RKH0_9ENTE|nr:ribokinase [Tetragenococcus koreensis]MCF1616307.1 ribokinase [Tetragenococcus koreensis]MCF1621220.1 ribokinase [Tetragenococcus koreensis]MCF1626178.1 ribokinase [Tetragenococcus koreensis]MCF1631214.1 ribokinase [Tetragenococcus koreensis]MCF1677269.1 ribokinase [Tetragenococcus koreensis]